MLQFVTVHEKVASFPTHTSNIGEVTAGVTIGQTFMAPQHNLSAVAVKFATYSGRSNTELVQFNLHTWPQLNLLRRAAVSPAVLGDNQLYRFGFEPIADSAQQTYLFTVSSPTAKAGNAVTVDVSDQDPYPQGSAFIVRHAEGSELTPEIFNRSGKARLDVAHETYVKVPAWQAGIAGFKRTYHYLVSTWDEQRSTYWLWLRAGASVAVVLGMVAGPLISRDTKLSSRVIAIMLSVLFVLAVIVRVMLATNLPLTNDEGNYLYDAYTLRLGVLAGGDGYVKALLPVSWISMWQAMVGNTLFAGRLASIIASALTLVPIYWLGHKLWSQKSGLLAATLWAVSGAPAVFGIYAHTQPVAILFGVSGLAVLVANPWSAIWAGGLLGLAVVSRKSMLALGPVVLLLILTQSFSWRRKLIQIGWVGIGFIVIILLFLLFAHGVYGLEGIWEALGINSAEDGLYGLDATEEERSRDYSIRGMTPFFRESLPFILLSLIGLGVMIEQWLKRSIPKITQAISAGWLYIFTRLAWVPSVLIFWWAWNFFVEHERGDYMVLKMSLLWWVMGGLLFTCTLWPWRQRKFSGWALAGSMLAVPVWLLSLAFFYANWIKFHANYIGEFLPPMVLLAGAGLWFLVSEWWPQNNHTSWSRGTSFVVLIAVLGVTSWAMFASSYVTMVFEHTGTFKLRAVQEAAEWAKNNIPIDQPIFTGAAAVPYLSGHRVALDIAHPRWYAYEFSRKNTRRLNTFLPPIPEMVDAFHRAEWVLWEEQTRFSFLMEYDEIAEALKSEFESVQGIENGSNTLVFYKRIKPHSE